MFTPSLDSTTDGKLDSRFAHLPLEWQRCIEHYLQDLEARSGSAKSRKLYGMHLAHFFAQHSDPALVSRHDVDAFLRKPQVRKGHEGEPVSISMHNGRRTAIARIYAYASEYEVAPNVTLFSAVSPARGFHDIKVGRTNKSMSQAEVARFFAAIDRSTVGGARWYCIYLFLFLTARRLGEIQRLVVRDIEQVTLIDGASRRIGYCFHFRGKGRSRIDDSQELPQLVYDVLQEYWRLADRLNTLTPDTPLFTPVYHGVKTGQQSQLCGAWIAIHFKEICKVAGLPAHLTPHSLRHASARARAESGSDLFEISKTLRHQSIATTQIYLAGITSSQDKGAALLANLPFLASTSGSEASR